MQFLLLQDILSQCLCFKYIIGIKETKNRPFSEITPKLFMVLCNVTIS